MLVLDLALAASIQLDRCRDSGEAAQGVSPAMAGCFVADCKWAGPRLSDANRAFEREWMGQRDEAYPLDNDPGAQTVETSNNPACLTGYTNRPIAWLARFL